MACLNQLFLQHVVASFDKQLALSDIIGSADWSADIANQTVTFGSRHCFKMQVMGTESTSSNTWLWAWANQGGIPAAALRASQELHALGRQNNIPEFMQTTLPITEEINGHNLTMIAAGVCNGDAYYRGPYDGGAVFMIIRDQDFPRETVDPAIRIPTVFSQAISALTISNHKVAFRHYVEYYHGRIEETDNAICAEFHNGNRVEAKFEPSHRLTSINSSCGMLATI
ncbi:hypothetical protein BGZ75_009953 [Mortierella antarctica]|nr:hypothetical protein BGZ75_009953 [Mortierella antarctica]